MIKLQDFKSDYKQIKSSLDKRIINLHKHNKYILGPEVFQLEDKLSKFAKYNYCTTLGNGTDALFLSLMSLDLKKGSDVLVPAFSWISSASSILLAGLNPVFVDIDINNGCIDYKQLELKITKKTKCLITVNIYGNKPNYKKIIQICNDKDIKIIEDAAQSFGSINTRTILNNIDIMCTSFFPAKTLGCYGDGGACFTNSKKINDRLKLLKILGQEKKSYSKYLGINSRLDTMQACVLLSKLSFYKKNLKRRYSLATLYKFYLNKLNVISILDLSILDNTCTSYPILVSDREKFVKYMNSFKIEIGLNYPYALIDQPIFKKYKNRSHRNCLILSKKTVCLPINPFIKDYQVKYIVKRIKKFILINNGI